MSNIKKRVLTSIFLLFLIYISFTSSLFLFLLLLLLSFIAIKEFHLIFTIIYKKNSNYIFFTNIISILYITIFSITSWIYLSSSIYEKKISLIYILSICIFTDMGGFAFGKLFGGKKLTKISPNKTYAGMIGSFLFSIVLGYLIYYYQKNILNFEINILILIVIISFISQIGDLSISLLKRKAKIKDTGSILPGHGGILDRLDGIMLAIPLGIILISI